MIRISILFCFSLYFLASCSKDESLAINGTRAELYANDAETYEVGIGKNHFFRGCQIKNLTWNNLNSFNYICNDVNYQNTSLHYMSRNQDSSLSTILFKRSSGEIFGEEIVKSYIYFVSANNIDDYLNQNGSYSKVLEEDGFQLTASNPLSDYKFVDIFRTSLLMLGGRNYYDPSPPSFGLDDCERGYGRNQGAAYFDALNRAEACCGGCVIEYGGSGGYSPTGGGWFDLEYACAGN